MRLKTTKILSGGFVLKGIKINGTGLYVPKTIATNEDFTKIIETNDEWITTRTGIKQRHIANGEPAWYLGAQAAKQDIKKSLRILFNCTTLNACIIIITP